jgi:DNA-binding Lrp family transcriptional regulator
VLLVIATEPGIRLRDIADAVGITESAAHRLVVDLEDAGYLTRHRMGLRNFYEVHPHGPLRHELEKNVEIGDLLGVLLQRGSRPRDPEPQEPKGG